MAQNSGFVPQITLRGHPESMYPPRGMEGGRRKAYESVLGGGGGNALAYVRFEKKSTSDCILRTAHSRISNYQFKTISSQGIIALDRSV